MKSDSEKRYKQIAAFPDDDGRSCDFEEKIDVCSAETAHADEGSARIDGQALL